MSTTHEEIQVDLDALDDKGKGADGQKEQKKDTPVVRVADPAPAGDKTEEGLENLKKQLDSERAQRIDAERRAQEASESEARARGEVHGSQIDLITNAIETIKQSNASLKTEFLAANAAGDVDRLWEIQQTMSTNAAKLLTLESGKTQLEKQPKPQPRPSQDLVEEYVGRIPGEYPRSRAWVRAHPEYVRDPQKNRLMIAAHELALARDLKADTDQYFESIEKTLDLRKTPANGEGDAHLEDPDPMKDAASKPIARKPAPAAAPVTRSGNGTGGRPNTVTLTPEEVETASLNGLTPEEYARNKLALKKEGRLN